MVCVVRAVARQREVLLTEQGSRVQRRQKTLVQKNIQLTEVLTDVKGMIGQAIIRTILLGEYLHATVTAASRPAPRTSSER